MAAWDTGRAFAPRSHPAAASRPQQAVGVVGGVCTGISEFTFGYSMLNVRQFLSSEHNCTNTCSHGYARVDGRPCPACTSAPVWDRPALILLLFILKIVLRFTGADVWCVVTTSCFGQFHSEQVKREGVISEGNRGHTLL